MSCQRLTRTSKHQQGVGMIEVLITLLILSIGLLGAAQLQIINLQNTRASEARMIATMLASDLAERIRANPSVTYTGITASGQTQSSAPAAQACVNGCSPTELAAQDSREWLESLTDVAGVGNDGNTHIPLLPNATANLTSGTGPTGSPQYILVIRWQEQDTQLKQWVDRSYEQVIELINPA